MIIDIHTHSIMLNDPRQRRISRWTSPEELLSMWDALGIDRGVVLPLVHHEIGAILQTSENVLDMYARWPDRIIPFCNLDARWNHNRADADFTPVLEHYKELGCKGVGEFVSNLPWDDDRVLNLLSHVEKAGLPLLFHVASRDRGQYGVIDDYRLTKLEFVLKRFPRLQFIAHSMGIWSNISGDANEQNWMGYPKGPVTPGGRLITLMRTYDNLWADISAGSGNNAIVRDKEFGFRFLEEFQDRILFGTDICQPGQHVPQVDTMNEALASGILSKAAYDKICYQNAQKLLGL
ncbi:MAG: amidohydrolase family protein [Armatimonadota bacterium]|nr:amidohydrolase family protein [Armatimonadota bacterium]